MRPLAALPLLLLLVLACAAPRQKLDAGPHWRPEDESFGLVLNNRNWLDMNIFVQYDGQASRVGMVTATSSRSLVLPARMLGQSRTIRVIAEAIGTGGSYTTDDLVVQPGQIVLVNLEHSLPGSHYSVQ